MLYLAHKSLWRHPLKGIELAGVWQVCSLNGSRQACMA